MHYHRQKYTVQILLPIIKISHLILVIPSKNTDTKKIKFCNNNERFFIHKHDLQNKTRIKKESINIFFNNKFPC